MTLPEFTATDQRTPVRLNDKSRNSDKSTNTTTTSTNVQPPPPVRVVEFVKNPEVLHKNPEQLSGTLIRAEYRNPKGTRRGYQTHLNDGSGKPVCGCKNRGYGSKDTLGTRWLPELGDQPTCLQCAKFLAEIEGGVA